MGSNNFAGGFKDSVLLLDELNLLCRNIDRLLQKHSTTGFLFGQGRLLSALSVLDGVSQSALSKSVSLSPATVTEMLDKLEASGFVERKKDGSDSRRLQVYITDRGRVAATEMEAERIRAVSELFAVLSPDEVSELERLVSKLNGSLHGVEPPAPQPRNTSEFYGLSVKSVRGPLTRSRLDKIRGGIRLR